MKTSYEIPSTPGSSSQVRKICPERTEAESSVTLGISLGAPEIIKSKELSVSPGTAANPAAATTLALVAGVVQV